MYRLENSIHCEDGMWGLGPHTSSTLSGICHLWQSYYMVLSNIFDEIYYQTINSFGADFI
jgi:hypothetical protein